MTTPVLGHTRIQLCSCCGRGAIALIPSWDFEERKLVGRCKAHMQSNPCVVSTCSRTKKNAHFRSETDFICKDHWRTVCPPRSAVRAAYNRFFRLAKKFNAGDENKPWPEALETRYWRFWFALVRRARRDIGQAIDEDEINRLFGWE